MHLNCIEASGPRCSERANAMFAGQRFPSAAYTLYEYVCVCVCSTREKRKCNAPGYMCVYIQWAARTRFPLDSERLSLLHSLPQGSQVSLSLSHSRDIIISILRAIQNLIHPDPLVSSIQREREKERNSTIAIYLSLTLSLLKFDHPMLALCRYFAYLYY